MSQRSIPSREHFLYPKMLHPLLKRGRSEKRVETLAAAEGSRNGHFGGQSVKISDQKREQILRLVAEGANLNPLDLDVFYRWVQDSYVALGFDPFQQQRFDEYCRSSNDSTSMRVYLGVWLLRAALGWASYSKDLQ